MNEVSRGSIVRLLVSLLDGEEASGSADLPDPPASALAVYRGKLGPESLSPGEISAALSSWVGPGLLVHLLDVLAPADVHRGLCSLSLPPLGLPRILARLAEDGDVIAASSSYAHLEGLLATLPADLPARLVADLGLPGSLGVAIDGLTFALEAGASRPLLASATHPLSVALERLGAPTVWDLFPCRPGGLVSRAGSVPVHVLESAATALGLLGASGCALRLLVLVLLLVEPDRVGASSRRSVTRLLLDPASRVPAERVVDVWSLANR